MFNRLLLSALTCLVASACAGSSGPIYEFQPTPGPLHYEIIDRGSLLIETPMGEQRSSDSTKATLRLEIGQMSAGGRRVSVAFETLDIWAGGDFQAEHIQGGELIGRAFTGTLSDQGIITVTEAPEIPAALQGSADPAAIFADLLLPLPPTGEESADSWSHATTQMSETTMSMEGSYEGTATFAGDTTWNGRPARIIVSEGNTMTSGRGTPVGAPGEIEMVLKGKAVTRYIWDPARGVMLGYRTTSSAEGELEVLSMAMAMPISYQGAREVRLIP